MDAVLLQLADSAFPTGGYAFSTGLEAAWQSGFVRGPGYESWLDSVTSAFAAWELPFVSALWGKDLDASRRAFQIYDAQAMSAVARAASLRMGGNWARILSSLRAEASDREKALRDLGLPLHQVPVMASVLSFFRVDLAEVRFFLLWMFLRDQISCAVRLGILGPMEAASLHHQRLQHLERLSQSSPHRIEEARRTAPLWDVVQGLHGRLYSRLFQS